MNPVANSCGEPGCIGFCILDDKNTQNGGGTPQKVCRCCSAIFDPRSRTLVQLGGDGHHPLCGGVPGRPNLRVLEPNNGGCVSTLGLALLCLALAMPCMVHHQ